MVKQKPFITIHFSRFLEPVQCVKKELLCLIMSFFVLLHSCFVPSLVCVPVHDFNGFQNLFPLLFLSCTLFNSISNNYLCHVVRIRLSQCHSTPRADCGMHCMPYQCFLRSCDGQQQQLLCYVWQPIATSFIISRKTLS